MGVPREPTGRWEHGHHHDPLFPGALVRIPFLQGCRAALRAGMSRRLSIRVHDLYLDYEIFEDRRAAIRDRLLKREGTGRSIVRALKGVSFDVSKGEAVGIIGSNGSGKSTLLAAVAGLLPPTSGEILVSDEPKLLGVGATLIPTATGYRNIRIGCTALGMSSDELEHRMAEIAAFTDLGEALDRRYGPTRQG